MAIKQINVFTKDNILFVAGLIGIGYQTFIDKTDRPTMLLVYCGMMGLNAYLKVDEIKDKLFSKGGKK